MCEWPISASTHHRPVRQDRPALALQAFDRCFLASAKTALSSGSANRARSLAFSSHNGTPSDLASARSSFSHCSWHSSCASRRFAASNVSVGVSPISIVKMLCRTFAVILPFTISPSSNTRRKALERADDALLSVYFSAEAHQNVSFAFCFALAARLPFFVAFPHVV